MKSIWGFVGLCLLSMSANAALLSRAGGLAYYDDVLGITWLADANYAQTSGYDSDGVMTWSAAQTWITSLNTANHLGVNDWRLPTVTDTGPSGCDFAYTGTDCGYNVDLSTGEMAHLFYSTLGNLPTYNTSGGLNLCASGPAPYYCLTNVGPFSNLQPSYPYWSGTVYAPNPAFSWYFNFSGGTQRGCDGARCVSNGNAWAVFDGDALAPVPVPAAVWLFGGALGVLGWVRRKQAAT